MLVSFYYRTHRCFSLFLGYWPSKNASRDHGIKGEFVSFTKPIFYVPLEREFYVDQYFHENLQLIFVHAGVIDLKRICFSYKIVFGTTGKRILCWRIIVKEPKADFSLFLGYWSTKNESRDHDVKGEFVSLAKPIVFGTGGKNVLCTLTFS